MFYDWEVEQRAIRNEIIDKAHIKNITWIYRPGQAGVDGNNKAEQLTAGARPKDLIKTENSDYTNPSSAKLTSSKAAPTHRSQSYFHPRAKLVSAR